MTTDELEPCISDADIEAISEAVGFSPLAWDLAEPKELVRAALKHFGSVVAKVEYKGYEPSNQIVWMNNGLEFLPDGTLLLAVAPKPKAIGSNP